MSSKRSKQKNKKKNKSGVARPRSPAGQRARKNRAYAADMQLANQHYVANRLQQAQVICGKILTADPDHADANYLMAAIYHKAARTDLAIGQLCKTLKSDPNHFNALSFLAGLLSSERRFEEALEVCKRTIELKPKDAKLHLQLATSYRALARFDEAIDSYQKAIEIDPSNADALFHSGVALGSLGRTDEAKERVRRAISVRPSFSRAYFELAALVKREVYCEEIENMEKLFAATGASSIHREYLGFALGKAFEDLQQFDKSFEYYAEGNRLYRNSHSYSVAKSAAEFEQIQAVFNGDFLGVHEGAGIEEEAPIFILGMPRSGTSLVEQVLASHPQVHGCGELSYLNLLSGQLGKAVDPPFPLHFRDWQLSDFHQLGAHYLDRMKQSAPGSLYLTDKLPHNFIHIGLISLALPNSKIIHCRRDSMDTCFSMFKNRFAKGHLYSYSLQDLGAYYRLYEALMCHWEEVLPERVYDIQYEDLVSDPEPEIRRLLDQCGLPFDSACLEHHKTKRLVRTLSQTQVRQPINVDSVQRWRRYEKHLQPLQVALGLE